MALVVVCLTACLQKTACVRDVALHLGLCPDALGSIPTAGLPPNCKPPACAIPPAPRTDPGAVQLREAPAAAA